MVLTPPSILLYALCTAVFSRLTVASCTAVFSRWTVERRAPSILLHSYGVQDAFAFKYRIRLRFYFIFSLVLTTVRLYSLVVLLYSLAGRWSEGLPRYCCTLSLVLSTAYICIFPLVLTTVRGRDLALTGRLHSPAAFAVKYRIRLRYYFFFSLVLATVRGLHYLVVLLYPLVGRWSEGLPRYCCTLPLVLSTAYICILPLVLTTVRGRDLALTGRLHSPARTEYRIHLHFPVCYEYSTRPRSGFDALPLVLIAEYFCISCLS